MGDADTAALPAFARAFRQHRACGAAGALDFAGPEIESDPRVTRIPLGHVTAHADADACLALPPREWRAYAVRAVPGLVFVANPFDGAEQREWVRRCLCEYTRAGIARSHVPLDERFWERAVAEMPEESAGPHRARTALERLRWVTLGFHYDWTAKTYREDDRGPFPTGLAALARHVVRALGHAEFEAEAAIVNFYALGSHMGGHTDHSEPNREAPLVSVSFGNAAVFLIGGHERDDLPLAMVVRSGDVVVMSGHARLCYHGVPRIVDGQLPPCLSEDAADAAWAPFARYISRARINANVRQVTFNGHFSKAVD